VNSVNSNLRIFLTGKCFPLYKIIYLLSRLLQKLHHLNLVVTKLLVCVMVVVSVSCSKSVVQSSRTIT